MKTLNKPEVDYYISPKIKDLLDKARHQVVNRDWDRVYLIDGSEGSGKSLLGLQLGSYLDPGLNLDRITFTGEDFGKAIDEADKNQCIIFDEAFNGLSSSAAMSRMNRFLVRKLMECRQKNLFIIIILPTVFLLQKYVAVFRSKALFHVYVTKAGVRGYYKAYNPKNKKILFLNGQKMYSYYKPYIKKSHRFYGKYPLDEQAYREKKRQALETNEEKEKVSPYVARFAILAKTLKESYNLPYLKQIEILKQHNYPLDKANISRQVAKIA